MKKLSFSLLTCILVAGVLWAEQRVDETRSAEADVQVDVDIVSGSIRVTGWDRPEVRVTGTIGDDVEALEVTGSGNSVSIDLDVPDSWGRRHRDIDARLELSVPAGARLTVETVSADITVSEVGGTVELASVSGQIELSGSPTRAEIESVSGDIRVDGHQTAIAAETVSGDVELRGVAKSVEAASVSGDVGISAAEVERAMFESVSGSVEFTGSLAGNARLDVETHSGNVTLVLPADTSATWEIETFSGNVNNDFGPAPQRTNDYGPGKWLKFTTGTGEARITLDAFSGNIWLKKQ